MSVPWGLVLSVSVLSAAMYFFGTNKRRPTALYPPGPKPLPILGNVLNFPATQWWLGFTELCQRFGPLVHLSVATKHIVVIGDQDIATELLEGTNCADRPPILMAGELMGFGISVAFIRYSERWRTYRRICHPVMSVNAVRAYDAMLEREAQRLLLALSEHPTSFREQMRFSLGRTIMDAMYGIDCPDPNDTYIKVAEATLANIAHAVIPGSYMVDIIPWLQYLPYIGLPFQKAVRTGRKQVELMVQRPYKHVHRTRSDGTAKPSFTSALLDGEIQLSDREDWESVVSWAAATMYGAAGETMHATLLNFILAMMQSPEAQKKAQDELDQVVGVTRPPTFMDKQNLPYMNALVKEVARWRVALPLGVPHACREDIQFKGYHIPKGTILLPNVWLISKDPLNYKDPHLFKPERFLGENPELDPLRFAFGYGPRTCIGKNFAISQMFIFISSILWAFEINPADGPSEEPNYSSGFVSAPFPFTCRITPRKHTKSNP